METDEILKDVKKGYGAGSNIYKAAVLLVKYAKQEVFADLANVGQRHDITMPDEYFKETGEETLVHFVIPMTHYQRVKNKHLHPIPVKAVSAETDNKTNEAEKP